MGTFIPLLWILSTSFILTSLLKIRVEKTLWLTLIIPGLVLLFFGMFHQLRLGFILLLSLNLFYFIYYIFRCRDKNIDYQNYFTYGLLLFIIIYFLIIIQNKYTVFITWDEFTHWGKMVRDNLELNGLYSVIESSTYHKNYPPIISLIQSFWCLLSGGFSETYCYRAINIFVFSVIFSLFDFKKEKRIMNYYRETILLVLFFLVSIIPLREIYNLFVSIYLDVIVSFFSAIFIYKSYTINMKDKFQIFNYILLGITLIYVKQIAIAFFFMGIFILILRNILSKSLIINLKKLILILVIVLGFFIMWDIYTIPVKHLSQFNYSSIDLHELYDISINNIGIDYKLLTKEHYISSLLNTPLINTPFNMSYVQFSIILTIIITLLTYSKVNILKSLILPCAFVIGIIGYAFTQYTLYLFCYSVYEATNLASYCRYMNIFILFGLYLILFLVYKRAKESKKHSVNVIIIIFIISISINGLLSFDFMNSNRVGFFMLPDTPPLVEQLNNIEIKDNKKIIIIDNEPERFKIIPYLNFYYPKIHADEFCLANIEIPAGPFCSSLTNEAFKEYVSGYDYLYTMYYDYPFYDTWTETFTEYLLINRLYEINDGVPNLIE